MKNISQIAIKDLPLGDYDVLSIDVFDTALTRRIEAPVDVFALTEARLVGRCGSSFDGFALVREAAELQARQRIVGREEITFDEIYDEISLLRPVWADDIGLLKAEEIEAELAVLRPVAAIMDLVQRAEQQGLKIVFVSDMYLPQSTIRHFLTHCGYGLSFELLVSSETRRTKATGSQWKELRSLVGDAARILHVGDDEWSDVGSPGKHGVTGWRFIDALSDRRPAGPLSPAVLPFARLARGGVSDTVPFATDDRGVLHRLGTAWGGIVAGSFVRWLEQKAVEQGLTHLCFCARDGWLPMRIWQEAGCSERTGVSASYLYVSRRALNLAEIGLESASGLSPRSMNRLASSGLTARQLLQRSQLTNVRELLEDVKSVVGNLDAMLEGERLGRYVQLLKKHEAAVCANFRPMLENARSYLTQELSDHGRVGCVDIGWNGTIQVSVARIAKQLGLKATLPGYYVGLWPGAQNARPLAGSMEGFLTNDYRPMEERRGLHAGVALIENLFLAPNGSTLGYTQKNERWVAELQSSPVEKDQHERLILPFQNAATEAATAILKGEEIYGVRREDLTAEAALAAVDRLSLSPSEDEIRVLGSIVHAIDYDHVRFRPLVTSPSFVDEAPDPWSTDWAGGTAWSWRKAALAEKVGSIWRDETLKRISTFNNGLDSRTARFF